MSGDFNWNAEQSAFFSVDGFDYRADYTFTKTSFVEMAHIQFFHLQDGQEAKAPCPLTVTGFRSAHIHSVCIEAYADLATACAEYVQQTSCLETFNKAQKKRRELAAQQAQMSLF